MPKVQDTELEQYAGALLYRVADGGLEVLLVHPVGKGRKKWAIPQVPVSAGENFEEAARLDVAQQTGIPADHLQYLGYADYPKRRLHCFYGRAHRGKVPERMSLEISDARFLPIKQADALVDKRQKALLGSLKNTLAFLKESA